MIDTFMLCVKSTDIMIVNFSVKRKYNGKVSTNLLTELTSIIELNSGQKTILIEKLLCFYYNKHI